MWLMFMNTVLCLFYLGRFYLRSLNLSHEYSSVFSVFGTALLRGCIQQAPKKFQHGCRMLYAGCTFFFGLWLEDGHVPTFWLLLCFVYGYSY